MVFGGLNANGPGAISGLVGPGIFVVALKGLNINAGDSGLDESRLGAVGKFVVPASPVVSPPAPGVPEPSTWVMLMAGFGLVGAAVRRRQALATA